MTHTEKKITKIIEELTLFFFAVGGCQIQSGIEKKESNVIITFQSNFQLEYQQKINHLEEYLNEPKNEGIEDLYWELAGSGDPGESSQILLVGMMVDKAEVLIKENMVFLKLYKQIEEE